MARTSTEYYINPSAISVKPNANGSANDLAVYVARGAKIKVYYPKIFSLDTYNAAYQEWTISGRNRRVQEDDKPYAIYARLNKTDMSDAYIVFAVKDKDEDSGEWTDPYVLSPNTSSSGDSRSSDSRGNFYTWPPIPKRQAENGRSDYWWIKIGSVSEVGNDGLRTVEIDTGILGTDQFNTGWALQSDDLPKRIEILCTIDGIDVGQTPYVRWDKKIVLSAHLEEGWNSDVNEKVTRWEIIRNTGNTSSDSTWLSESRMISFGELGCITLSHGRNDGDDFGGAIASTFTVNAWGVSEAHEIQEETILASETITILAETVESYEIESSESVVSYNPENKTYSPADHVIVRVRAKSQDGTVFYPNHTHIETAQLHVYYLPVGEIEGEDAPPELTFDNGIATLPISVFEAGKGINLWLENEAQVVLARTTVGYVCFGVKGDAPINIYRWYKEGLTPVRPTATNSDEPAPADSDVSGATNVYPTDKWSKATPGRPDTGDWALWMCSSIRHAYGTRDAWAEPVRISGSDGDAGADGNDREYIYKRLTSYPFSGTTPANIAKDKDGVQRTATYIENTPDFVPLGWSDTAIEATADEKYVYFSMREKPAGTEQKWGPFSTPTLWSNWGVQGMDGDGAQYAYKLFDHELTDAERTDNIPAKPAKQNDNGEWIPSGWSDDPQSPTVENPYCYCSVIKRINGAWGNFEKLGLWSKWSKDGDPGANAVAIFRWYASDSEAPSVPTSLAYPPAASTGWFKSAPNRTDNTWLWMATGSLDTATNRVDVWSTPVRISGDQGTPGEDADRREWIYRRNSNAGYVSTSGTANGTTVISGKTGDVYKCYITDNFVPNGWSDHPSGVVSQNDVEYASWRDYNNDAEKWEAFHTPVIWSRYGKNGIDGDGIEYVFIRTKTYDAPHIKDGTGGVYDNSSYIDSNGNLHAESEFLPIAYVTDGTIEYNEAEYISGGTIGLYGECTDNPKGASEEWPYEWVIKRSKAESDLSGFREWRHYSGDMSLWTKWSKDGQSVLVAVIDNEMDSVSCTESKIPDGRQVVSTNVSLWRGAEKIPFLCTCYTDSACTNVILNSKAYRSGKATWWASGEDTSNTVYLGVSTSYVFSEKIDIYIKLTAADDSTASRVVKFSVNGIIPGANGKNAVLYRLVPSAASFVRKADGTFEPDVLIVSGTKVDGTSASEYRGAANVYIDGSTTAIEASLPLTAYPTDEASAEGLEFSRSFKVELFDTNGDVSDVQTMQIVRDGVSQEYFTEMQEAWSSEVSTASPSTAPSDITEDDWADGTPSPVAGKSYLWRRSRQMKLNDDKIGYVPGVWLYVRLSGTNGTSIETKGEVATVSELLDKKVKPFVNGATQATEVAVSDGWAYVCRDDGHLYQWSDEKRDNSGSWTDYTSGWIDLGQFKGEPGVTYYTHIAWATAVLMRAGEVSRVVGFTTGVSSEDGFPWMGVYVDTNPDVDSRLATSYTWQYVKGATGNGYSDGREYYAVGNSPTEAPDGKPSKSTYTSILYFNNALNRAGGTSDGDALAPAPWSTQRPAYTSANGYLWNFEVAIFTDGTVSVTPALCIGNMAKGIVSVAEYYALSKYSEPNLDGDYPYDISNPADGSEEDGDDFSEPQWWSEELTNRAPTESLPYQWNWTHTEYNDGTADDFYHVSAVRGNDGANSLRLDLDNEHDDFLYDGDGNNKSGAATSQARLYDGSKQINPNLVGWSISEYEGVSSSVSASNYAYINANGLLTIKGISKQQAKVTVRAEYPKQSGNYCYASFTANKQEREKYELVVTPSSIAYNTDDGPESSDITVLVKRTSIDGTWVYSAPPTGYAIVFCDENNQPYGTNSIKIGVSSAVFSTDNAVQNEIRIFIAQVSSAMRVVEETALDVETVPVCKSSNGQPGSPGTKRQRRYRSVNSGPAWPYNSGASYDPNTSVSGWSESPTALTSTARYRYMTERTSQDGGTAWTVWSTPVIDAYLSKDGNSISIKGMTAGIIPSSSRGYDYEGCRWDTPVSDGALSAMPDVDADKPLLYNNDTQSDSAFYNTINNVWEDSHVNEAQGVGYLDINGHLWIRNTALSGVRWTDAGLIKGDKGDKGDDAVRMTLDNQMDSIQYQGDGTTKVDATATVTTTAYLYDGTKEVSDDAVFSVKTGSPYTTLNTNQYSLSGRVLTVSGISSDTGYVTLQCTYKGAEYNAKFTVVRLRGTDRYSLVLSPTALTLNSDDGWASNKIITIRVMRTPASGGVPYNVNPALYGLALTVSDGTLSGSGTLRTITLTQAQAAQIARVTVTLHKAGDVSSVYDQQDIAVVKTANGGRGAMGKMCYIAGEYDPKAIYTSTDTQTVAVEIASAIGNTVELWYLVKETNVVDNVHYAPSDDNDYWERGLNNYNLIRTRYLFADFAVLGSAIICGDWMFSACGKINGVEYNSVSVDSPAMYKGKAAYAWFDPSTPNTSVSGSHTVNGVTWEDYNFVPNYALDLLTGKTYQNDAYIKGEVHATSGEFAGTITAENGRIGQFKIDNLGLSYKQDGLDFRIQPNLLSLNGGLASFGGSADRVSLHSFGLTQIGALVLDIGNSFPTAYNQQKSVLILNTDFTLPSSSVAPGTVLFLKGVAASVNLKAPSNGKILSYDGNLIDSRSLNKRSAIYIFYGSQSSVNNYKNVWFEFWCG